MKIRSSCFERATNKPEDAPKALGPDVFFLGRSNVGKSTLINRLLGTKGLARTSSQPGRTQTANFYRVNDSFNFVDLPGYGYAKVPERVRKNWGPMVESFLERRHERIALAMLVVDARHKPTVLDGVMRDWLEDRGLPYLVAATKTDKLSGNARTKSKKQLAEFVESTSATAVVMTAAEKGMGVREIWKHLEEAFRRQEEQ